MEKRGRKFYTKHSLLPLYKFHLSFSLSLSLSLCLPQELTLQSHVGIRAYVRPTDTEQWGITAGTAKGN